MTVNRKIMLFIIRCERVNVILMYVFLVKKRIELYIIKCVLGLRGSRQTKTNQFLIVSWIPFFNIDIKLSP